MPLREGIGRLCWGVLWWVVIPAGALTLLVDVAASSGPSFDARFGDTAVHGVFTGEYERCGGKVRSCTTMGTFVADDGSVVRSDVLVGSGGPTVLPGDSVRVKDTGDEQVVYPRDGGWDWLLTAMFAVGAALVLVVSFGRMVLVALRRTPRGRVLTADWRVLRWLRLARSS